MPVRRYAHIAVLAVIGLAAFGSAAAGAQDASARNCFWQANGDANAVNVAYPDEAARYWLSAFTLPPGSELVLRGRYPHARYISFNAYDGLARPTDALSDLQLAPDPGAANPFVEGSRRDGRARSYTATIVGDPPPSDVSKRRPSTLYLGLAGQRAANGAILYRVYLPDRGRDTTGDAGLPEVSLRLASGAELAGPAACDALDLSVPPTVANAYADGDGGPAAPAGYPAQDPLRWYVFFNVLYTQGTFAFPGTPAEPAQAALPAERNGGYLSNLHNAYAYSLSNRSFGRVLVLRGKAPTYPRTVDGRTRMEGGQVRYWSLCENERLSTRFVACLVDEDAVVDRDQRYVVVMTTPADRPKNARRECGVNWLPYGPQPEGNLILRHMLPSPGFAEALQNVAKPGEESRVGEYLPSGRYTDPAGFEALGCRPMKIAAAIAKLDGRRGSSPAAAKAPRRCTSRRRFRVTVRVPRGVTVRHVRVTVPGRRARVSRRRTVLVDLTGRPPGTYVVRLRVRTSNGRVLRETRRYRTCRRRA